MMKQFILILSIAAISCCSTKSTTPGDRTPTNTNTEKQPDSSVVTARVPECINKLIAQFKAEEKQNPPRKIYSYTYREKTVYYVPALCCDFYSELYDSDCKIIGHPDGGFTGKGDGNMTDFHTARTNEKLIWADERK